MRIVASVQPKRGSSRGLVHYIAHSKLDVEREPDKGREIFNAFADELSVKSANNSIKVGMAKGRPSNDQLHHLVLSLRPDDYRKLGSDDKQRRRGLKEATRAAMHQLEIALGADRLYWVAAVHRNTENPHVHIAIQKQFFTQHMEREMLAKFPREALPHFETSNGQKVFAPGFLIEASAETIELMTATYSEHMLASEQGRDSMPHTSRKNVKEGGLPSSQKTSKESEILGRATIAEFELLRINSKIKTLVDHGQKMRFPVADPVTGQKRRLSLHDIEHRYVDTQSEHKTASERQIKTILLKMLGKEEVLKEQVQHQSAETMTDAIRIRANYRKQDRKLPTPFLTKEEIDRLQEYCLEAADIRRFSYLEGVRSELENSGKIEPRDAVDFHKMAARKTVSELVVQRIERDRGEFNYKRFYRVVNIRDRRLSLAQLDRETRATSQASSLVGKLKNRASQIIGKDVPGENEPAGLKSEMLNQLDEESKAIEIDLSAEKRRLKIIEKVSKKDPGSASTKPVHSIEQMSEIEALALRLRLKPVYDESWTEQRTLIESATNDAPAVTRLQRKGPQPNLIELKTKTIGGRALAREIVAKVHLQKAKEDLKAFTKSGKFHKFRIVDKESSSVDFVSMNDLEGSLRGSTIDRAVRQLFESRSHRDLRREVSSLVKAREHQLRSDVAGAKEIMSSAMNHASEFKRTSFLGLRAEPSYQPLFTSSEIRLLEMRVSSTRNSKEARHLRAVLDSVKDQTMHSLKDMLQEFISPATARENVPSAVEKGTPTPPPSGGLLPHVHEPRAHRTLDKHDRSR